MNIEDIGTVQKLMANLKAQNDKLTMLGYASNIHISFNGPSQNQIHLNFSESYAANPDEQQADYAWNGS
jgi:UDP-N-acetylenolpyruvoylglucosamine reductase